MPFLLILQKKSKGCYFTEDLRGAFQVKFQVKFHSRAAAILSFVN